jgi:hypothetical protein
MDAANQKEAKRPRMMASMVRFRRPYLAEAAGSTSGFCRGIRSGRFADKNRPGRNDSETLIFTV